MRALQIESRSVKWFAPLLLALSYPFLLHAFSNWAGAPGGDPNVVRMAAGWLCLLLAVAVPLVGLAWAYCLRSVSDPGDARVRDSQTVEHYEQ